VNAPDNHIDLYRRVVDPEHPGLFFVGLIQPLGSIMPLAEIQAEWVGDLVSGEGELPSYAEMRTQIEEYDEELRRRYVASKRHTIQVDFHKYFTEIERERRASKARAQGRPVTRAARLREGVRGGVRNLADTARSLRT
jgi:dimethylaniline monooxygenase (N-oxide forming)